ncbi:MAG TPA: hypothetical protein VFU93_12885 [Acidimicrobiales bacterium]|nr:hypothetical protein [Acidimicrobiales bacterium]
MTDERKLQTAALLYLGGLALHTADHLRRGFDAVTEHVFWAGNVSTAMGLAAVALILTSHRLAPAAAVAFGFPIAIGVAAVHLLPEWSTALSDSFIDQSMSWMSWTVVAIEIVGALATGIVGWRLYRRDMLAA